jgi:protein-arginine kinase activator protein McsA
LLEIDNLKKEQESQDFYLNQARVQKVGRELRDREQKLEKLTFAQNLIEECDLYVVRNNLIDALGLDEVKVTGEKWQGETVEELRMQLNELVRQEQFEEAAVVRDKIKEMEGGINE